ncbi:MAG: LacI family DNA-binding transcriptional regulator [Kiritimatiellae bacterium]|nr:LacI family DNA-binding transcriptional regulator [Kiritimatiellia bacterium]
MAHLKDIAEAAGVSIRTVTRVLKRSGYVEAQKRKRIEQIAKKLGYRPNRIAQSLRMRKSFQIGFLVWSIDELRADRIVAFQRVLRKAGYLVNTVFAAEQDGGRVAGGLLEEMIGWQQAGIGVLPYGTVDLGPIVRRLRERNVPNVVVGGAEPPADVVVFDRGQGIYDAVHYLWQSGRRRIAFLGRGRASHRAAGYRRAMKALRQKPIWIDIAGLQEAGRAEAEQAAAERVEHSASKLIGDVATVRQFAQSRALMVNAYHAARKAAKVFAKMSPRPDAVQAYSDVLATGFLAGLLDLGISVPREVALVGFDNRLAASLCHPALTTVAQPNMEVGVGAAEILIKKIAGEPEPRGGWSRTLPCRLVVREST